MSIAFIDSVLSGDSLAKKLLSWIAVSLTTLALFRRLYDASEELFERLFRCCFAVSENDNHYQNILYFLTKKFNIGTGRYLRVISAELEDDSITPLDPQFKQMMCGRGVKVCASGDRLYIYY